MTGIKSTNEHFSLWILTGFGRWIYTWKSCLEYGFRTDLPVWHCYAALYFFLSTYLVCLAFLMMFLDGICSWNDFRVVYEKKIRGGDLWAFGGIASLHKIGPQTWFYKVSYYNNSALAFHNLFLNFLNGFDVRFLT